tara:strand:- start:1922 stop:3142 length:1221 start_codon:yes stop_codon:yes gene_type:complete
MEGGSKRELLNKVDATLLVFDGQLAHMESGEIVEFQDSSTAINPDQLAQACSSLLPEQQKDHSVLLLLPPEEFVATTQDMPGVGRDNLVSALKLQVDSLLPTFSDTLVLAVNPESAEAGSGNTALWVANQRLMKFFEAFKAQNIFLVAIKPRLLNVTGENANCVVDEDRQSITAVKLSSNGVVGWWHVNKLDFEQEIFEQQWQQQINEDSTTQLKRFSSTQDYLESSANQSNREYAFFPSGALTARHRVEQGWRLLIAAGIVAALLLLSAIPFIGQSLEFRSLAASLESQWELSIEARQDQAVVVSFENEWGPINDFPVQDVGDAMYTLQSVLSPDRLSSLEVSEGLVRIQGTSQEPQAILERLEQNPMFTEVVFSRATNNNRYYIDLRISTVNFEAYMVRYFPDE